jgi:isorenieratene synthase
MGGPLSAGHPRGERLVCPWHGLSVCSEKRGSWKPLTAHDDGHLVWVQPDGQGRQSGKSGHDGGQSYEPGSDERGAEALTSEPILPPRPKDALAGVIRVIARCEPSDVIANRLDPWHGARYHQHTFARLRVLEEKKEAITVQVAFRVAGPVCTEVICTFHTPEPRTIVMTIIDGEGKGSIVETHATPLTDGWSAVTELIMATSDRYSFRQALRMRPLLEPLLGRTAKRLWNDDAAYAERSYALRSGLQPNEWSTNAWQRAPGTPYPR